VDAMWPSHPRDPVDTAGSSPQPRLAGSPG
jgi:hypothetical protein